jgi:O-antigen ligase
VSVASAPAQARASQLSPLWLLLLLPFALGGLVDMPRIIQLGPVTALGVLSIVQLVVAVVGLAAVRAVPRAVAAAILPYALFVGWMALRSLVNASSSGGLQPGVAFALLGAQFLLGGTLAAFGPAAAMFVLGRAFVVVDIVGLSLVLVSFLLSGIGSEEWLIGPRAVALFANVPICWHLAGWCYGRPRAGLRALAWILAVVVSLSRTAIVVAVVVAALAALAGSWLRPARLVTRTPALVIATLLLLGPIVVYQVEFSDRFFSGFNSVEVAGMSIETSGRNNIWPAVIESAMQHPLTGGGLGSSQAVLSELWNEIVSHPHNEYLRIWHDGGLIGLALFALAIVQWLTQLTLRWLRAARAPARHPELQLAALLTLIGLALAAITDNGLLYASVVSPSGALIGAAFGAWAAARRRGRAG